MLRRKPVAGKKCRLYAPEAFAAAAAFFLTDFIRKSI